MCIRDSSIAQQGQLVIEMGVESGAVDHGALADIHHRDFTQRTLLQQGEQGVGEELPGTAQMCIRDSNRAAAKEYRRQEDQKEGLSLVDNEPRQLGYRGFRA